MWAVIGVDADGAEHVWTMCQNKQSAEEKLQTIIDGYDDFRAPYINALAKAEKEEQELSKAVETGVLKEDKRPLYTDYMGWKDQGFYVKKFVIREVQDENI